MRSVYIGTGTQWLTAKRSPMGWLALLILAPLAIIFILSVLLAVAIVAIPFAALVGLRKLFSPQLPAGPRILPPDEDGSAYSVIGTPTSPRSGSDAKDWPFDDEA